MAGLVPATQTRGAPQVRTTSAAAPFL